MTSMVMLQPEAKPSVVSVTAQCQGCARLVRRWPWGTGDLDRLGADLRLAWAHVSKHMILNLLDLLNTFEMC